MSQNQEVRVLMRPAIWSALPLLGSGTKSRIRVPAVIPKTGDTYGDKKDLWGFRSCWHIMLTGYSYQVWLSCGLYGTEVKRWTKNRVFTIWMYGHCVCRHASHPIQVLWSWQHSPCLLCWHCVCVCVCVYACLCVGLSMCVSIQDSKRLFWLWELPCELCTKVKTSSAVTFTIIFSFMGYEVACLCMCVSVWGETKTKGRMECVGEGLFE